MKIVIVLSLVVLSFAYVDCGDAGSEGYITNGQEAEPNQFPYQVGLLYGPTLACGGTLISNQWILTAAHCIIGPPPITISVSLGTIYINGSGGTTVDTTKYFIHENFNYSITASMADLKDDIALIKLESPVEVSDSIKPASLPVYSSTPSSHEGSLAVASGWGIIATNDTSPSTLQYIDIPVISNEECQKVWGVVVSDSVLCASTSPDSTSTCSGDSGGPLVLSNTNTIIGVSSFGYTPDCKQGFHIGFTRVTSYLDWIENISGISAQE